MPPSLYRGACQSWQRQRGVQTVPWLIFLDLDLRATKFEIYNHWWKRQANIFNLFGKCYIPHHPINGLDRASYAYLGLPHYLKLLGWYILSYIIFSLQLACIHMVCKEGIQKLSICNKVPVENVCNYRINSNYDSVFLTKNVQFHPFSENHCDDTKYTL